MSSPHGGDIAVLGGQASYDRDGIAADEWSTYVDKYALGIHQIGFASPEAFHAEYSELIRIEPVSLRGFH